MLILMTVVTWKATWTVAKHESLQSWTLQNWISQQRLQGWLHPQGYRAVPGVTAGGYFHDQPHLFEFVMIQLL